MSRQFRYRVAAIVLGGLIFGAPLLANGTASAEQFGEPGVLGENGRAVTFEGGNMLGLSCRSRPEVESLVVPPDSTVRVVNRTGYSARLELGGDAKGTLPDDGSTDVIFRRGTTAVSLKPNCPLGEDATPLLVTASPSSSAAMPDPTPAPSGGSADAVAIAPSGTGEPSGAQSGLSHSATTAGLAARSHAARHRPGVSHSVINAVPPASSAKAKAKVKRLPRTPGGHSRAYAGMPAGDAKTMAPGVPAVDVAPPTPVAESPVEATPPAEIAAAEPVAAMVPMRDPRPLGMLASIAAVCVLGVGAAAIRAIVSQRANRAKMA